MAFNRPLVMGVLNATPDSFSDGGLYSAEDDALNHARLLIAAGSNIIDVGGESTRPGAERIAIEEEQRRVISLIKRIATEPSFVASGAMNSQTARAAIEAGAKIINDVSGGLADPEMFSVAAETSTILVISHWRGFSDRMDSLNEYQDVARDVAQELSVQVEAAIAAGVKRENIVIDPGLGFAKDMQQNWKLVARLDELEKLGLPILVGASRKRFIAGMLEPDEAGEVSNSRRDLATAVLTALLLQRKLWGIRVHNVLATTDAIDVVEALRNAETQ
jgi:dihydropteroate synthase